MLIVNRNQKADDDDDDEDEFDLTKEFNKDEASLDPNSLSYLTAEFCNIVLGREASKRAERFQLGNKLLTLQSAISIVLREHYFTAAWMFASLLKTRTQRFLDCFKTLLVALFIDTLIYGIFYPSDGKCETYQTDHACSIPQAKLGGNQCVWNKEATIRCTPVDPPRNVISVLILALVITVLMRPALLVIDFLSSVCERRPRFESWWKHWSTNSWLGSLHHSSYLDYSPLAMAFVHHDKVTKFHNENLEKLATSLTMHNTSEVGLNGVGEEAVRDVEVGGLDEEDEEEFLFQLNETREEEGRNAKTILERFHSPHEEMKYLLDGAQETLERHYNYSTPILFDQLLRDQAEGDKETLADTQNSSKRQNSDWGLRSNRTSFERLSFDGKLSRGPSSSGGQGRGRLSSVKQLMASFKSTREESTRESASTNIMQNHHHGSMSTTRAIEHQLGIYSDGSLVPLTSWQRLWYNNREHWLHSKIIEARKKTKQLVKKIEGLRFPDRTLKDIAVIRSFIAEHVSLPYRSALRRKFEEHEFLTPEETNPLFWIIGWMVQLGTIAFCLYWVLAWGITNTGSTLKGWGNAYIASALQDIFLFETTKMGFMFVFTLVSVRPQLSAIRQVINEAALSYIQHGPPKHQSNNDVVIVQHFSPSCRAASLGKVKTLAAAAILRQINDADYEKCQQHRSFALSVVVYSFMFVMAVIGLINERFEDAAIDPAINAMWTVVFVAISQINIYSPTTVIVLVLVGCSLYFYYTLLYPDVMKTARNVRRADIHFHHVRRGSHQHYEHQRHLRQAHHLPWNQRVMHECRRSYASLRARVIYYWSLLQFICSSEYWTYSDLQRSHDDALWMELNRWTVLNSANIARGSSATDEIVANKLSDKRSSSNRTKANRMQHLSNGAMEEESQKPKKIGELFTRNQSNMFMMSFRTQTMIGGIPPEIMAMRPSGITIPLTNSLPHFLSYPFSYNNSGDAIDLALELKRKENEVRLMGMLLKGVKGGLTALQGDAFTYEDVDHRTLGGESSLLPILYVTKPRADVTQHIVCDVTKDKEKALRRILARMRQVTIEAKYLLGDPRRDVFITQEIKDYYVTFEELAVMVEWAWTMYAPGGVLLSREECQEAYEEFEKWRTTGMYWDPDGDRVNEANGMGSSPGVIADTSMKEIGRGLVSSSHMESLLAASATILPIPIDKSLASTAGWNSPKPPIIFSSSAPVNNLNNSPVTSSSIVQRLRTDKQRQKYLTRAVSFLEFSAWFIHLTSHIEHTRYTFVHREHTPTMPLTNEVYLDP